MSVLTSVALAAWIDEMAEQFGREVEPVAGPEYFPAPVPVEERLLVEVAADVVRERRQRRLLALRLHGALLQFVVAALLVRALRPAGPAVDPDDVSFTPSVDGVPSQLVGDRVQRALAWMEKRRVPTVLGRGAVASGDRAVMPDDFYPAAKVVYPVGERFVSVGLDVDPRDQPLRTAIGRYERAAARLASGEIGERGYAWIVADVFRSTGVSLEVAEAHSERVAVDRRSQDVELLWWLHRDEVEIASERARLRRYVDPADDWLAANDPDRQPRHFDRELAVTGMLAGSGERADREWLHVRLSQIRTDCTRALVNLPVPALEGRKRSDAIRKGVSLSHRYTLRRLVEVMCDRDDREFREAWGACERWRRENGLTYEQATVEVAAKLGVAPERYAVPNAGRNAWSDVSRGSVAARAATLDD